MLSEIYVYFTDGSNTVVYVNPGSDIKDELSDAAKQQGFNINEIESYEETGRMYRPDEILI